MGSKQQDQQKSIVRNRLAENAKRILNQKSFDTGQTVEKTGKVKSAQKTQEEHLAQSGFTDPNVVKKAEEPSSYTIHKAQGELGFEYKKQPYDSVCKPDPPIKNLNGARYNIITGSVQPWFNKK